LIRQELSRVDAPADLVQVLPAPVSKERTRQLMCAADLVVVTGSQNNVKSAYSSGTPAIGVGAGNVPVVIDSSADLERAAQKICASKTFDNSTSCSSENAVILIDDVYDAAMEALVQAGGYRTSPKEKSQIETQLWIDGNLNPDLIARDAAVFSRASGLSNAAGKALFFMVEESHFSADSRFADEKLSLVLTVYRARDFDDAIAIIQGILDVQGRGHSCGLHTGNPEHARRLAEQIDVVRVLVNQAHTFGNGGSFDNGLNFTLSMGCGTWGGNSISENLNYRHFINVTHLSTTIEEDRPSEEELFGSYWDKFGK
jgi:sulfoacetaldehyde dehydrogenase